MVDAATPGAKARLAVRRGKRGDAGRIAEIYNQGIDDRLATFETEHRTAGDIEAWFDANLPLAAVEREGEVIAYAVAHPYRSRPCYAGVREFSVYVAREARGTGAGKAALEGLIELSKADGAWKLLSRIFPENTASLALCRKLGFRVVGTYERHGKLDGKWRDCVIVEKLIDD
ncbi:N-acetyltransferase family protein [Rhizobiales bacterium]|uniref:arsinothricin resistance N-acetyltransferase ArsN1 family A n=1 Tax=Hongsoonwoonella zoysiae TaxID=2821844 RepID=UPI001560AE64|nr:arsinothricin resistance N-acetyltransferase ArsN1 family A [Hongsoonwoonella zoysiae]NRG19889.1 N-acetyltransferase family protein [Hongsoonwoonella zoysiae]